MLRTVAFTMSAALVIGVGVTFIPGTEAPARAQRSGDACPSALGRQRSLECYCSAEATETGLVYGSAFYADDSSICRAARHAGVIDRRGGLVSVYEAPGQSSYPAVERNGITSNGWGNWPRSIAFRVDGQRAERLSVATCPPEAGSLGVGESLSCTCEPGSTSAGTVWGSGPYTSDSGICRAALHAGAVTERGGVVRLRGLPGRTGYMASSRNGVSTSDWGTHGRSYEFVD